MAVPYPELTRETTAQLAPFRQAQKSTMQGFGTMAEAAMAEGALSAKVKELLALSVGITQGCHACIGYHVKALVRLGTTRTELEEAMAVAVYMGGGPALMHVADVLRAWEQFSPAVATAAAVEPSVTP